MIEILLFLVAIFLGSIIGSITGLLPGIHINLIAVLVTSSLAFLSPVSPIYLAVFIASLAITHTFIDFIPAILLGAPEEDTYLSILPGHEMLNEGKGYEAIILTLYGSMIAIPVILLFTPFLIYLAPLIENKITLLIPFILIFISVYMVLREEKSLSALIVFILAGFLGFATLNLPVKEPLLPLLTGLFGASAIITSLKDKIKIKKQIIPPIKKIKLPKKEIKGALAGLILTSPIFSFLPALGSGYAALLSSELFNYSRKSFLFLTGSLNTIVMGLSFILVYSLGKSRTGAAAAIETLLQEITLQNILIIILSIVVTSILAFFLTIFLAKIGIKMINKVNYKLLSLGVLIIIFIAVLLFSNLLGILVFITSTSLGVFCILSGARRVNLMGSLIIPTILIYLI